MKLNKGKCEVPHLTRNMPRHCYTLGINWLESNLADKTFGSPHGQQAKHQAAKKASDVLDCIRRSIAVASKSSEVIFPLYSGLVTHLECCVPFWALQYKKDMDIPEQVQHGATKMMKGKQDQLYKERLRELGLRIKGGIFDHPALEQVAQGGCIDSILWGYSKPYWI